WSTGEFGQSIVITTQDWYTVVVTDDFACEAEDSCFVEDPMSISDMAPPDAMNVYPNPANNEVFIELSEALSGMVQIEFVGASGATLLDQVVEAEQNTPIAIDTQHLPEGVYLIKVSGRGRYAIHTLLINR
ncbi:MAG: T9SS type A sorting domain-containing protein, partial [Salinivirgaceae bacterium]